jgi:hypothetical protein
MKKILLVLLSAMPLVFPGCNLWEDRKACPKILAVDCSLLEGKALYADIWIFGPQEGLLARSRVDEHEFYRKQIFEVQEGDYNCYVWANLGDETILTDINTLGGKIYKSSSGIGDPLFAFAKSAECRKDSVTLRVVPRKMFIDVFITLNGLKDGEKASAELMCPYGGFTLAGEPLMQQSLACAEGNHLLHLRMMRPGKLEGTALAILFAREDGRELRSDFELGNYLVQNNYDLLSDNLKDIYITIDVAKMKTVIGTQPFENVPPVPIRF